MDIFEDHCSTILDFPGSSDSKVSAYNAGEPGSIPGLGKTSWRRKWQPTPVFLPGKSHGQSSLVGYTVHGVAKSWTRLRDFTLTFTFIWPSAGCACQGPLRGWSQGRSLRQHWNTLGAAWEGPLGVCLHVWCVIWGQRNCRIREGMSPWPSGSLTLVSKRRSL